MLGAMNCATRGFFKVFNGSFYTTANAYIIQAADPGYGKSHTTDFGKNPIQSFADHYNESIRDLLKNEARQRNKLHEKIKKLEKKISRCKDEFYEKAFLTEITKLERDAEKFQTKELVIFADDITIRSLIEVLADQNERIAIMNSEIGILRHLITAKNNSNYFDKILRLFNGDSITFDRSEKIRYTLNNPILSLYTATQIEPTRDLFINQHLHEIGCISRMWITIGDDRNIGYRTFENTEGVLNAQWYYQSVIHNVLDRIQRSKDKYELLHFDTDAEKAFKETRYEIERELQQGRSLNPILGWSKKLCNHISTLAAFIHLYEYPTENNTISHNTLINAIDISRWLSSNMISLTDFAFPEKSKDFFITIGKKIYDKNFTSFTPRDIARLFSNVNTEDVKHGIYTLMSHGAIYAHPDQTKNGPGRPSSKTYSADYYILRQLLDKFCR